MAGQTKGTEVNCEQLKVIRNLDKDNVLVVTKEELMRGVDYRCTTGIDLLIAKEMSSDRAFL